jgi:hypothetical protein
MTFEDAAALLCAILGSENVKDSIGTVASMRKLEVNFRGRSGQGSWIFDTGIRPEHNIVEALAQVFQCFDRENEIVYRFLREPPFDDDDEPEVGFYEPEAGFYEDNLSAGAQLYVLFEVQYPQHYAFITVGVRKKFMETWTYGRRGAPRNEQVRRVRGAALREIAEALRPPASGEAV